MREVDGNLRMTVKELAEKLLAELPPDTEVSNFNALVFHIEMPETQEQQDGS